MPKLVDHNQRRKLFIVSAMSVLANKGYEAFNLRAVAEEAGFTTGAMAHYFEDRDSLLLAVFHFYADHLSSEVKTLLNTSPSPSEQIHTMLRYMLPVDDYRRAGWKIWFELSHLARVDEDLRALRLSLYKQWHDQLDALVQNVSDKQDFIFSGESRFFPAHLLAWLEGFTSQALIDQEKYDTEFQQQCLCNFLEHFFKSGSHSPPGVSV